MRQGASGAVDRAACLCVGSRGLCIRFRPLSGLIFRVLPCTWLLAGGSSRVDGGVFLRCTQSRTALETSCSSSQDENQVVALKAKNNRAPDCRGLDVLSLATG